jgi:hypothetical protein
MAEMLREADIGHSEALLLSGGTATETRLLRRTGFFRVGTVEGSGR